MHTKTQKQQHSIRILTVKNVHLGKYSTSQKIKHNLLSTQLENVRHNEGVVARGTLRGSTKLFCWLLVTGLGSEVGELLYVA